MLRHQHRILHPLPTPFSSSSLLSLSKSILNSSYLRRHIHKAFPLCSIDEKNDALSKRRKEIEDHFLALESSSPQPKQPPPPPTTTNQSTLEKRNQTRTQLLLEAKSLTISLYRRCFRSITAIRPGNARDEAEFDKRDKDRLDQMEGGKFDDMTMMSFSMGPVNRENELRSRADYYYSYCKEHFVGEMDCLDQDPWMGEGDVEKFVRLIRRGEESRKWVLEDYGFEDPCCVWEVLEEGLASWEGRAMDLVRETYVVNGWNLNVEDEEYDDDDDDDDDEEEEEEEDDDDGFWDEDEEDGFWDGEGWDESEDKDKR